MNDRIKSPVTGKEYYVKKSCRIIDPKQQMLYLKHNLTLLDIYHSTDFKTGGDIVVMVFDRQESYPYYDLYCKHELK